LKVQASSITGVSAAAAGSAKVEQTVGVLSGQKYEDVTLDLKTGAISGTGIGVLGKGTSTENIGVLAAATSSNFYLKESLGSVTTIAAGIDSSSSANIGYFGGRYADSDKMTISAGNIRAEAYGLDAKADISIGDFNDISNLSGYIDVGNVYARSISASSSSPIRVGYDLAGGSTNLVMNIKVGNIDNKVDVAVGGSSEVYVGTILKPIHQNSRLIISTGDLSSHVVAALGGTNGILIGNINTTAGGNVEVHTGNQSAEAVACIGHVGCLSELVGKKNCIMIGNVGLEADCGNESLIGEAVKELEHLGYEVEQGFVKAGKAIVNTAKNIGKDIKHFFSGW
jgi:hypothetical protein